MRFVCLLACAALTASSGSAWAADCNKGMLWPYVRTAGDCLTDAEITAGQTGVYSGPTTTNVDVSAIKPDPALQNNNAASSSGSSGGSYLNGFVSGGLLDVLAGGSSTTARAGEAACTKGAFWPFLRDPGDCLTEKEKKEGHRGVYRADEVVTQASATTAERPLLGGTAAPAVLTSPTPATPTCSKGWLWPFVRNGSDCLTDIQKKDGGGGAAVVTPVNSTATGAPQAYRTATPAASPTAAAAPSCSKSLLWPFVKSAGDCPTEEERKEGRIEPFGAGIAATPVNATPAAATQAAGTATQSPNSSPAAAPACNKGWLWPFVKSTGDCPTDADKK
jgi:hypothetical protein